jgi:hypothetical protein
VDELLAEGSALIFTQFAALGGGSSHLAERFGVRALYLHGVVRADRTRMVERFRRRMVRHSSFCRSRLAAMG